VKLFLVLVLVAGGAGLAVASVLFRSERATKLLKQLRLAAFAYIIAIIAATAYRIWQQGGL